MTDPPPASQELVGAVGLALEELPARAAAVLGLSGGPDSCGLLALVVAARPDLHLLAVHVRHGLRDDRADAEAARAAATALAVPFDVRTVTVRPAGEGIEAAAREARLALLAGVAREHGASAVLLGHTADDQAETVLLRLARGTGVGGLAAMRPRRRLRTPGGDVVLVRPLLGVRRTDVRAAAAAAGLQPVEDPTNRDRAGRRVRARLDALPALGSLAPGGDAVPALVRLAELAAADAAALDAAAGAAAAAHVIRWGPVACIRTAALDALDVAVRTRVVRRLLAEARGRAAGLGSRVVAAALELRPGQTLGVPGGGVATCGGGWLAVAPAVPEPLAPRRVPAELPEVGAAVVTVPTDTMRLARPPGGRRATTARVGGTELLVRGPIAGDRLRTADGTRSVSGLLGAAGVPRLVRPLVPVVCDADGRPRWLPAVSPPPDDVDGAPVSLVASRAAVPAPS